MTLDLPPFEKVRQTEPPVTPFREKHVTEFAKGAPSSSNPLTPMQDGFDSIQSAVQSLVI